MFVNQRLYLILLVVPRCLGAYSRYHRTVVVGAITPVYIVSGQIIIRRGIAYSTNTRADLDGLATRMGADTSYASLPVSHGYFRHPRPAATPCLYVP
jgi:hypothetical protein